MKRTSCVLFTFFLLISSISFAATSNVLIKKGDKATVPSWEWVDVLNEDIVYSGNNDFTYGETCGIDMGGTVTVIGEIDETTLLVCYTSPEKEVYGTPCPTGIIFELSKESFCSMTNAYLGKVQAIQEHKVKKD